MTTGFAEPPVDPVDQLVTDLVRNDGEAHIAEVIAEFRSYYFIQPRREYEEEMAAIAAKQAEADARERQFSVLAELWKVDG